MNNLNKYIVEKFKIDSDIKVSKEKNKIYFIVLNYLRGLKKKDIWRPEDCFICHNIDDIEDTLKSWEFSQNIIKKAIKEVSNLSSGECIQYKGKDNFSAFISCFEI